MYRGMGMAMTRMPLSIRLPSPCPSKTIWLPIGIYASD